MKKVLVILLSLTVASLIVIAVVGFSAREKEQNTTVTTTTATTTTTTTTVSTTKPTTKTETTTKESTTKATTTKSVTYTKTKSTTKKQTTTRKSTSPQASKPKETTTKKPATTKPTATAPAKHDHSEINGNMGKWFNSRAELNDYYNNTVNYWVNKEKNGEITMNELYQNCPYGYECWSCPVCHKWTGNFYYR